MSEESSTLGMEQIVEPVLIVTRADLVKRAEDEFMTFCRTLGEVPLHVKPDKKETGDKQYASIGVLTNCTSRNFANLSKIKAFYRTTAEKYGVEGAYFQVVPFNNCANVILGFR